MALTKVTGQVIKNTTDVTVGVLTVTNTLAVGGTVSIGGTLTYEDVTNVDAVGLITARNGIVVGSGITLSKDGDGFFTGIVTATSYAGSGANLTGIDTDLVSDTSPQLGGDLDTNGNLIKFADSNGTTNRLMFGTNKFQALYDSGNSRMSLDNLTGAFLIRNSASGEDIDIIAADDIRIRPQGGENGINVVGNGAVELYHDNSKKFETKSYGASVSGYITASPTSGNLGFHAGDSTKMTFGTSDDLQIFHDGSNSNIYNASGNLRIRAANNLQLETHDGEMQIKCVEDGQVELYYDNGLRLSTESSQVTVHRPSSFPNPNNTGSEITGATLDIGGNLHLEERYPNGAYADRQDLVLKTNTGYGQGLQDKVRFSSSGSIFLEVAGSGISFEPHGSSNVNLLDDYEEGSFTPTMKSSNNLPTFSYTTQRGKYVKVGRQVTVWIFIYATIGGTETGNLYIQGLPFIVRDEFAQMLITDSGNWDSYPSNHSGWGGYAELNDDHVVMLTCGDKNAGGVHASNWGNNTYLYATMSYMTDS